MTKGSAKGEWITKQKRICFKLFFKNFADFIKTFPLPKKKESLISLQVVCALGPLVSVFVHVTHYSPTPLSAYTHELTPTNQSIFMYFIIMVLLYTIYCFLTLPLALCTTVLSNEYIQCFPISLRLLLGLGLNSKGEIRDPHTFILFIWIIPTYIKLHFFLSHSFWIRHVYT